MTYAFCNHCGRFEVQPDSLRCPCCNRLSWELVAKAEAPKKSVPLRTTPSHYRDLINAAHKA